MTTPAPSSTLRAYYELVKPGVLYGNVLTVVAGFLLAAEHYDIVLFLAVTVGMTLVIASACALNNYLDKDIDSKMTRTKKRPSVTGAISGKNMVLYAATLGVLGLLVLIIWTNIWVVISAIVGFVVYVLFYGALSKRMSVHGTLVGSISGAVPILAGYLAASGEPDIGAGLVFLILFLWQMPEFYSIAVYRREEYKQAGVPVISVVRGITQTKWQILFYTVSFVVSTLLLGLFGYAGVAYMVAMALLGIYWIMLGVKGIRAKDSSAWARKMFRFSLIILLAFCLLISVDAFLP